MTIAQPADAGVPPYLGRVLDADGVPTGTCFQVALGVLVTAHHVLDDLGAGQVGAAVEVAPLAGGSSQRADVLAVDPDCDLAVLRVAEALGGTISAVSPTDVVKKLTDIAVTGVALVPGAEQDYGYLDIPGQWQGGTSKDNVQFAHLSAKAVVKGMSGAPVRRLSDDVVVGVVSARYNSGDGWLRDTVFVARVEDVLRLLSGVAEVLVTGQPPTRTVPKPVIAAAIAVVLVLAMLAGIGLSGMLSPRAAQPELAPTSVSTSTSTSVQTPVAQGDQPVAIESTTRLERRFGDPSYVMAARYDMTPQEFTEFTTTSGSGDLVSWYGKRDVVPVEFGSTKITLRGNAREPVHIVDMKVYKKCGPPLGGTYFRQYTQGGPSDKLMLAVDLDSEISTVQELALTTGQGLTPVGEDYFAAKSIELAPGEKQDLLIGALTKKQSCAFTLQLVIATSAGQVTQQLDNNGKPFEVTAMAQPKAQGLPYSGYQSVYLGTAQGWIRADPAGQK